MLRKHSVGNFAAYVDKLMSKAFEVTKDQLTDVVTAPMSSLYEKAADPAKLKDAYRTRFIKKQPTTTD